MRKMKDSGVDWIGEIPADWTITKLKYFVDCYDGKRIPIDSGSRESGPYPYWGAGSVTDYINDYIFDEELVLLGEDGAPFFDDTRPVAFLINGKVWVNNHIHVLKPHNNVHGAYMVHFLNSVDYGTYINGSILNKLTQSNMNNIAFLLPSLEEQQHIAEYLDDKCSKIDAIIAQQQEVIGKLKAYKQSVITETVTKGLQKNVAMKSSNIDICDSIPSDWNVSQIRYLFCLRDEKNYLPLDEVKLLSLYTDLGVFPHGEQEERGNKAVTAEGYKVVYKEDIVVNIILAWMGAIGRSSYDGVTSPAYDIYIPQKNVNSKYYHYLFRTKVFAGECYKYGRGIMAMRWRTYSAEFISIKVPFPPISVQNEIVDYLDIKCVAIDKTIETKQIVIDKLTAYKKSLIYEVVTGKKEV